MNEALREHTTSIGFQLTLSKRQIDILVLLHHFKGNFEALNEAIGHGHPALRSWIVTGRCLQDRGLIRWCRPIHDKKSRRHAVSGNKFNPIIGWKPYRLTKAGTLTVNLLKEAGIYQERLTELLASSQGKVVHVQAS